MKTTTLFSVFALTLGLAVSSVSLAQVKIGTNPTTIEPNSNLEVEASTAGRKMKVDKTTGQVTITDGTQGAGKVFTSDANGAGSWQASALVTAAVNYTNDGVVTVGGSGVPGNVSITFPENGTYAVSFSFVGDTQGGAPFPTGSPWIAVSLGNALNHQENLIPGSQFVFVSGIRYVNITSAPITMSVSYINSSGLPFTIRGHSTNNYNDWFAYKVF
ncbi:hypothetical protein [Dyadobacter sp. MSC1_007]|jgi:hypothetical protein|uniref:hypothetical protein n=1 Tax=Dyadobacter sp. MSC1_007 TaxID=2909264 RepID=UPI00202DB7C7|nr:hypothetical protein [Dyadobacter sp. MSC1_007]